MEPSLLILAAGMGSRFGGLKQVAPLGPSGEKLLDYSVFDALRAGFGELVFVIRKDIEAEFRTLVGSAYEKRCAVRYVFQELDSLPGGHTPPAGRTKPWGTAHAVLVASGAIRQPFAVINADDFYGREAFAVLAEFLRNAREGVKASWAMVGYPLENTLSEHGHVSRGICRVTPGGVLQGVQEISRIGRDAQGIGAPCECGRQPFTGNELVSLNLWGFTPSIFTHLEANFPAFLSAAGDPLKKEFLLPSLVDQAIRAARAEVQVLRSPDRWYGVTYKEDAPLVAAALADLVHAGRYTSPLWKGDLP